MGGFRGRPKTRVSRSSAIVSTRIATLVVLGGGLAGCGSRGGLPLTREATGGAPPRETATGGTRAPPGGEPGGSPGSGDGAGGDTHAAGAGGASDPPDPRWTLSGESSATALPEILRIATPVECDAAAATEWRSEGVGELDTTKHSDAVGVVASDGIFHLAYADRTWVTYATKRGGTWQFEVVDAADSRGGRNIDLVLAPEGTAHLVYTAEAGLGYATNEAGAWVTEIVDPGGDCPCSLALDSEGRLHLASVGDGLRYQVREHGQWETATDLAQNVHSRGVSIALDGLDGVHVSSYAPAEGLQYSTNADGTWVHEVVAGGGIDNSLAMAPSGALFVVHSNSPAGDLTLSMLHDGRWVSATWLANDGRHTALPDLAVDGNGGVHTAQWSRAGVSYARLTRTGEWHLDLLGSDATPWTTPRLAVDTSGREVHVVYGRDGDIAHHYTDDVRCAIVSE